MKHYFKGGFLGIIWLAASLCNTYAQEPTHLIDVWPGGAPNSSGLTEAQWEKPERGHLYATQEAKLWVYLPQENPTQGAVIICPGGAYRFLSMENEGRRVARHLSNNGFAAIVLQYRVPNTHKEVPISDVKEAFAIVKAHADEWGIDPNKIGIMGFSAGGHLASYHANTYTPENKPAFNILIYPVTRLTADSHKATRRNWLENSSDTTEIHQSSPTQLVGKHTPPTFIAVSCDDDLYGDSKSYLDALHRHQIPVECHIFPMGKHGWGTKDSFPYKDQWLNSLYFWLNRTLSPQSSETNTSK